MKGYPSKRRVRKAFERGVRDRERGRGARNPYEHPKLVELYQRGYQMAGDGRRPRLPQPTRAPAPKPLPAPRRDDRRPRPFAPQPRRGGWR